MHMNAELVAMAFGMAGYSVEATLEDGMSASRIEGIGMIKPVVGRVMITSDAIEETSLK